MGHAITHHQLDLNGISLSLYSAGPEHGRPVWLLHGFPECWHSWRNQIGPLADAGYRVFVPEMRGYGGSDAPEPVEAYDLLTLAGDIRAGMDHFGQQRAAVVGHDWGANVAWYLALLEPERVEVLATMSVPFAGRPRRPAIQIMRELAAGRFNYILYFQEPGRAEQELDGDIDRTLRMLMYGGKKNLLQQDKPADSRLFDDDMQPGPLPEWVREEDFAVYCKTFAGHGFRGALNWYRNFERNWEITEPLQGRQVTQPTLFLIGNKDPVKWLEEYTLKKMPGFVPDLEQHELAPCGHWIQNEKADEVNTLMLDFLARRYPAQD
jgi:pimeloyl-ACP methyl ester carboxylesterase